MTLSTEEDFGVISVCEGDIFTPPFPRYYVSKKPVAFSRPIWALDSSKNMMFYDDSRLAAELSAWQVTRDEALENLEAPLSE